MQRRETTPNGQSERSQKERAGFWGKPGPQTPPAGRGGEGRRQHVEASMPQTLHAGFYEPVVSCRKLPSSAFLQAMMEIGLFGQARANRAPIVQAAGDPAAHSVPGRRPDEGPHDDKAGYNPRRPWTRGRCRAGRRSAGCGDLTPALARLLRDPSAQCSTGFAARHFARFAGHAVRARRRRQAVIAAGRPAMPRRSLRAPMLAAAFSRAARGSGSCRRCDESAS